MTFSTPMHGKIEKIPDAAARLFERSGPASGRAIGRTRSIRRGDACDRVAELSWGAPKETVK